MPDRQVATERDPGFRLFLTFEDGSIREMERGDGCWRFEAGAGGCGRVVCNVVVHSDGGVDYGPCGAPGQTVGPLEGGHLLVIEDDHLFFDSFGEGQYVEEN